MTSAKLLVLSIDNEDKMLAFGSDLAKAIFPGNIIYLHGELGVGKTTLARGFLRALGYAGTVKSPTYALVEVYELEKYQVYHFDLYRLVDAEELEYMGARDYFHQNAICLVEWPENGEGFLPEADLEITLSYQDAARRRMQLEAGTPKGCRLLEIIKPKLGLYAAY